MANHPNRGRDRGKAGTTPTAEMILLAREAAGLTQEAAALVVYTSWRTWQDWERGERRMHPAFWELFLLKTGARAT